MYAVGKQRKENKVGRGVRAGKGPGRRPGPNSEKQNGRKGKRAVPFPRGSGHKGNPPVRTAPPATREEPLVVGRNPVREALRAGRSVSRLWVLEGTSEGSLREILGLARSENIPVMFVPRARLDAMAGPVGHQGVIAAVSAMPTYNLEDLEGFLAAAEGVPFFYILDGIQDPQNLGTIIRVANATGALAVVIPQRAAAGMTPAVAKASAGAVEYVPVVRVANLAQAIETVKSWGVFVYAAVPEAKTVYTDVDWTGACAIVIGGEGRGVRPLVMKQCDGTVALPMAGAVSSLNAATAAAVIGFEVMRQRRRSS